MLPYGCFSLLLFLLFILILPVLFANLFLLALAKLGLSPVLSLLAILGIFMGSMINIPVKKNPHGSIRPVQPSGMFGIDHLFPQIARNRSYTIIAINVGGCVIPMIIAAYEFLRIAQAGWRPLLAMMAAVLINIFVCHRIARPVAHIGIVMHAFMPAIVAAVCGLLFFPKYAPLIAFNAGVLGPLIGADLLNLKKISRLTSGVASIGGAGTFDGIVISGLAATLLA